jgi:hypothetical protein
MNCEYQAGDVTQRRYAGSVSITSKILIGGKRGLRRGKQAELVALQFGDAVGYVAVIDVHGVDLAETVERLLRFACVFEGHA